MMSRFHVECSVCLSSSVHGHFSTNKDALLWFPVRQPSGVLGSSHGLRASASINKCSQSWYFVRERFWGRFSKPCKSSVPLGHLRYIKTFSMTVLDQGKTYHLSRLFVFTFGLKANELHQNLTTLTLVLNLLISQTWNVPNPPMSHVQLAFHKSVCMAR